MAQRKTERKEDAPTNKNIDTEFLSCGICGSISYVCEMYFYSTNLTASVTIFTLFVCGYLIKNFFAYLTFKDLQIFFTNRISEVALSMYS